MYRSANALAHDLRAVLNDDTERIVVLTQRAIHLSSRYEQLGEMDDLSEVIVLDREALSLHPPGHRRRPSSLSDLAGDLFSRYKNLGGMDDLNEAIVLGREALSFHPPGHPDRSKSLSNLAIHFSF